jgi:hypothetical protein
MEEDLNLQDGARSILMLYKNKYMENEENYINYSFAIMEFVVKTLQIISYASLQAAKELFKANSDQSSLYNRTRDFLLYNANVSLRLSSEQIMDKYLNVLRDQAQTGKTVLNSADL